MPVNSTHQSSRLALSFQTGTNAQGDPILRIKSLANVKPAALDQDLFDIASALGALQSHPLNEVGRVDNLSLAEGA